MKRQAAGRATAHTLCAATSAGTASWPVARIPKQLASLRQTEQRLRPL